MKMKTITALVFLIAVMFFAPAYSATVTVVAEGVFSEYTDPDGLLPFAEPASGTIFTISVTYDDTTPDVLFFLPYIGLYNNSISDMSLTIGGDNFGIGEFSQIVILNESETGEGTNIADEWLARTDTTTPAGTPNMVLVEGFSMDLATVLDSAPVPPLSTTELVAPSWPSGWNIGEIKYNIILRTQDNTAPQEELAWAIANITSITVVPIPAAVWLFGSALGLLGWMRRKRT